MVILTNLLLLLFFFATLDALPSPAKDANSTTALILDLMTNETSPKTARRVHIVAMKWESVSDVIFISLWLLVAGIAKLIFNRPAFTKIFPESALLIIVGFLIGVVIEKLGLMDEERLSLSSHTFFIYLLPPIIFDAGYFMPNRAFFKNWDSIVLFAVLGTLFNTLAIGFSLFYVQFLTPSISYTIFEILLFSALISAVDPVAVIAVFEEIHVNDFIFVNVFGEALFNDGVTVVLYELFKQYMDIGNPVLTDYFAGALCFLVVVLGGTVMGIVAAVLTALATKYCDRVMVLAPWFIFLVPYMGYLLAESLSISPIIAIAVCGMAMKQYVKGNISSSAANSVKYFIKVLAQGAETVIFLFLGLSSVKLIPTHYWNWFFIASTILCCIIFRTVGIIGQCAFLNHFRGKNFSLVDQFILSYGGLRGAIAFGLAQSIPDSVESKQMFVTATIAVIYFTVFLQGSTIRPLVNYLKVEKKKVAEPTLTESVYNKYLDYVISGVEDIAGQKGHASLVHDFERLNNQIVCPILMRERARTRNFDATKIVRAFAKITLREAICATAMQPVEKRVEDLQRKHLESESGTPIIFDLPQASAVYGNRCECPREGHLAQCSLSQPNVEAIYSLFNKMFDKRLEELRENRHSVRDDISDDYIQQLQDPTKKATSLHKSSLKADDVLSTSTQHPPARRIFSVPMDLGSPSSLSTCKSEL